MLNREQILEQWLIEELQSGTEQIHFARSEALMCGLIVGSVMGFIIGLLV